MNTTTNIRRWGNSQGLYIPRNFLHELGIAVNDSVTLSIENGAIVIKRFDDPSVKQSAISSLRDIREKALMSKRPSTKEGDEPGRDDQPDYRKEYEDYLDERYSK